MSEENAPYVGSVPIGSRIVDSARLNELEALERNVREALEPLEYRYDGDGDDTVESDNGVPLGAQIALLVVDLNDAELELREILAAIDPVRSWYDDEIDDDAEMVAAIVKDLQYDRAQAHMIREILDCPAFEVIETIKRQKDAARNGTDARIEIGRLRAEVQDAINTGRAITVVEILARLDGICEPTKATSDSIEPKNDKAPPLPAPPGPTPPDLRLQL